MKRSILGEEASALEPDARPATVSEPGYVATMWAAVAHRKTLVVAAVASLVYLLLFSFLGGMLTGVEGSQFPGIQDFPHFELDLSPPGDIPYLAFQPTRSLYLEMNFIQAGGLAIIGGLVASNVALSALTWRLRSRSPRQASSWLGLTAPFFVSNGACAACAGIPAGLAFLPASLAGGLLGFVGFYGLPTVLAILLLMIIMAFSLERANEVHGRQSIHGSA